MSALVCLCGHGAGSHSSTRFNCLATTAGTHATRCSCKCYTSAPVAPGASTPVPPHLSEEERALWEKAVAVEAAAAAYDAITDAASKGEHHVAYTELMVAQEAFDPEPSVIRSLLTALSTERVAGEEAKRAAFCAGADWATPHELTRRDEAEAVRVAALRYPSTETPHD